MAAYETVQKLALTLSQGFENVAGEKPGEPLTRDGVTVRVLKDDVRKQFQGACHTAHGDMLPDDWRYSMIESVADIIAEAEDEEDYRTRLDEFEAPIYTHELTGWLGSRVDRLGYVDDARREYGEQIDTAGAFALGWLAEFREVADLLYRALEDMADAIEASAEEATS